MVELAPVVATKFGTDETVSTAYDRQPDIRQMLRNEAVVSLLETLATVEVAQESAEIDIDAVIAQLDGKEGFGPKTLEAVRKALTETD